MNILKIFENDILYTIQCRAAVFLIIVHSHFNLAEICEFNYFGILKKVTSKLLTVRVY